VHDVAKKAKKAAQVKKKGQIDTTPLYILFVIAIISYILLQRYGSVSIIPGFAVLIILVALIALEGFNSVKERGFKSSFKEIAVVIIAVAVFWFATSAALGTSHPFDVVPSCSMLPNLQRGDLIVLQGIKNISEVKAPIVKVDQTQWNATLSALSTASAECAAYSYSGGRLNISGQYIPGESVGIYVSGENSGYIAPANYSQGVLRYSCGIANATLDTGGTERLAQTTTITIGNVTVGRNFNNSIIVYQTLPQDLFYKEGDTLIVHRVMAIVNASGSYYFLTWGDNNQGLDIQYLNQPPNLTQTEGKVVGVVPYLGYLKLAFSGEITTPAGCNYVTQH
jgi:signal peptidase I